ncbi:MAG: DNA repair protein RadA [Nitrospirae bacterium CG_4_9_14_3_um_filter_53_35]|nr:MAG: DNA repair protein RadA [Nitrospirae bacterium CG2_30_53_67]PIV83131.1 MAG: DNA repair protein RadA [Nitrospirae bacterium CG17_big_fil_post_rev_8_21_14_2_50_50_9]PIX85765.1 MAG: DNA repair protein RadA [Nitrospirae bacterium CG_4_10_14_3_um_filter_53_41]PJA74481.1 MAG: DNA repair protein RadA [Nitrospirae bacterium CG_4_9_14_3_um_filter_53_35]
MTKIKSYFACQSCGYQTYKWIGRCPDCGKWNSFIEEREASGTFSKNHVRPEPVSLGEVSKDQEERIPIGLSEMDRVLGGGLVQGSVTLIGGDPGIGKSTLLLQIADSLSRQGQEILYVTAEESLRQVKIRADRLGINRSSLKLLSENCLEGVMQVISDLSPGMVVIDSVQTVYTDTIQSAPGSVSQVREVAGILTRMAKQKDISVFLIGHVTKDGSIAGPRVLEHIVDTVLYFEGDQGHAYRIIRTIKNRFGSTQEIGVFEMKEQGLVEVKNPSEMFLAERQSAVPGSVVVASMEGTRPILVELQALVTPVEFGVPRRMTTGVDKNRVNLLIAVLEKRAGIPLNSQDVFVNVVGGITLTEPAAELGIISAVVSNFRGIPMGEKTLVFGETGLGGEVRSVSRPQARIREAAKLGFRRCILPKRSLSEVDALGMELVGVDGIDALLEILL